MWRLRRWLGRQRGQSIMILALGMITLLVAAGLVIDVGNAYALQRKVRNAVDAGALAGARELARQNTTTNAQVLEAARKFVAANGVPVDKVGVWYSDVSGTPLQPVNNDGFPPPTDVNGTPVAGVVVTAQAQVGTYLAYLAGIHTLSASEQSLARVICGACEAGASDGLFPVAVDANTFSATGGKPAIGTSYVIWGDKRTPGNFGWVSWSDSPGHTSETTLVANLQQLTRSGVWHVGDQLPCGPGVKNSSDVTAELSKFKSSPRLVTVPVYSAVTGTGENTKYTISGFVRMKIVDYNFSGNDKSITAKFENWVEPSAEGGCADMGVCTVKLRPPLTERRSIAGVVSIWEPKLGEHLSTATSHVPVDVVNVLDISGSMADRWGSGQEVKLVTAKRVLTDFDAQLQPTAVPGDRLGLVTFPQVTSGSYYSLRCSSGYYSTRYLGQVRSALTADIASVNSIINGLTANGGTPLAGAISAARSVVIPGAPDPTRVPVLIIASDGITNVTVDGRWTGFSGTTYSAPACNDLAVQDALSQANMAKQQGIIIFTIAIGDDFNSDLLRAIATADSDPAKPHFFTAVNQNDLASIYQQIATRVANIGAECAVEEFETVGNGLTVTLSQNGSVVAQTTTSASGSYVFNDVQPGTYTLTVSGQKDGMTFDVMTDIIGGPAATQPITVTAGTGMGTYQRDLYVRTSTPLQCH